MALVIPSLPMTGSRLKTSLEEIRQRMPLKLDSTDELVMLSNFVDGDRCLTPQGTYKIVSGLGAAASATVLDMSQAGMQAVLSVDDPVEDVPGLLADTRPAGFLPEGQRVSTRAEGYVYRVAATSASDHHRTTAGGVKLYVEPGQRGFDLRSFGAVGDGVTDDSAPMAQAITAAQGKTLWIEAGDYGYGSQINVTQSATTVRFERDARLIPLAGGSAIRVAGAQPSSWVSLTANATEGATSFTVSSVSGWAVGDWVELRSETLLPGANTEGGKCCVLGRISAISGTTVTLDRSLPYNFLTSAGAIAGRPTMVENVVIDGAQINKPDYDAEIGFGLYLNYCANVTVISPRIYGSKPKNAPDQNGGVNGISIGHGCINVVISNPDIAHIGWYGIGISGYVEGIRITGGEIRDCRHGISLVWLEGGYGEPHNVTVTGVTSRDCNLSCFDTHDTGRGAIFNNCKAFGSRTDSGFQIRNHGTLLLGCEAAYNNYEGIAGRIDPHEMLIENPRIYRNGRSGIASSAPVYITGGSITDNAQAETGYALYVPGGTVTGTKLRGNLSASGANTVVRLSAAEAPGLDAPLLLTGIDAASTNPGVQWFMQKASSRYFQDATIADSDVSGYASNLARGNEVAGEMGPRRSNNITTSTIANRSGRVTLTGTSTTVGNIDVIRRNSEPFWASNVRITRVNSGASDGVLSVGRVINNYGFTILSTRSSESSEVEWEIIG